MKRLDEMSEEEIKRATRWGIVTLLLVFVFIGIPNLWLFTSDALGLKVGSMSMFAGIRSIMSVFFLTVFLPTSALSEFGESRMFNRSFRPRNILVFLLLYGEVALSSIALLTMFDIPFSEAPLLIQAPLASVCLGISILIMAYTFKVKRFNDFFTKALGWA